MVLFTIMRRHTLATPLAIAKGPSHQPIAYRDPSLRSTWSTKLETRSTCGSAYSFVFHVTRQITDLCHTSVKMYRGSIRRWTNASLRPTVYTPVVDQPYCRHPHPRSQSDVQSLLAMSDLLSAHFDVRFSLLPVDPASAARPPLSQPFFPSTC